MTRSQLVEQIRKKGSYLCVGLDSDVSKIPAHLRSLPDPVFEFNRSIIDSTRDCCVAYKINTAFYESQGAKGWEIMQRTVEYIPSTHFKIADAKRGDIGNTSSHYARAFFETMNFDAVTVAPYMGEDSIRPFLEYPGKWTIVLGLTSNPGAHDFELLPAGNGYLYETVISKISQWGTPENMMWVIGATRPEWFEKIRMLAPGYFYLVPGVGEQGGQLRDISLKAMTADIGILVNVSRSIIYAAGGEDFAEAAASAASGYQRDMTAYIQPVR
ncbi:MAG TPA: orotidine-5'-phosphate decarboxylase [Puia sp.]|nr:orotidine-5'-phosphate decarboxylase [Puia sp.]